MWNFCNLRMQITYVAITEICQYSSCWIIEPRARVIRKRRRKVILCEEVRKNIKQNFSTCDFVSEKIDFENVSSILVTESG